MYNRKLKFYRQLYRYFSNKVFHNFISFQKISQEQNQIDQQQLQGDIDEQPLTKQQRKQIEYEKMMQQAKESRDQYKAGLREMKKLTPGKLIVKIMWGMMMAGLDLTIVTLCNPKIQTEKNFVPEGEQIPQSIVQWVNDIYSLTFAAFSILASKVGDRFGLTIVFWWGMVLFTIFSVLCGVSKFIPYTITPWEYGGFYVLVAARFFQGIAAAFLMANTMSLCAILVEENRVSESMAFNSLAFSISIFLGPVLGGILIQWVDWSICFDINVLICILGLIVSRDIPRIPKFVEPKIDILGGLLCLLGIFLIVLGLTLLPPDKNFMVGAAILIVVGLGILVGFVFWELYHPFALLPRILLKNSRLVYALLAGLFNFALSTPMTFQLPILLQTYHCIDPIVVGLFTLICPVCQVIAAIIGKKLAHVVTSFVTKLISSIVITIGILFLSFIVDQDLWVFAIQSVIFNIPLGLFFVSNNQFMMQVSDVTIRGNLGGCIQAFRETGFCLGICLLNMVQDFYISANWEGEAAIDPDGTCTDPYFLDYRDVYYKSASVSDWAMCAVSIFALVLGILSGFGEHESSLKCYPDKYKKLPQNTEEAQTLADNAEQIITEEQHTEQKAPESVQNETQN